MNFFRPGTYQWYKQLKKIAKRNSKENNDLRVSKSAQTDFVRKALQDAKLLFQIIRFYAITVSWYSRFSRQYSN